MKQRVVEAIRAHHLWEPDQSVAVAVSGGRDSMVLLDLLATTRGLHGARLSVVHVDHGQHPASATTADHVVAVARRHDLTSVVLRPDLAPGASEATARAARYAAFSTLAVDRIALGHHRRDQAETVLINLLRGTGPTGLRGMTWHRDRYVRPLLDTPSEAIGSWQRTRGLTFHHDPANASDRFLRNRIRGELLPLLDDLRSGAVDALATTASTLADDDALLDRLAADLDLGLLTLATAPRPLVTRRLRQLLPNLPTATVEAILAVVRRGRGAVLLPGGGQVVARHHRLVVEGDSLGRAR